MCLLRHVGIDKTVARLFEISRAMSTELAQNIAGLQSGASVQVASSDFLGVVDAPLNIPQLLFYIIMGVSFDFMGFHGVSTI